MAGEEGFSMSSLALILAKFFCEREGVSARGAINVALSLCGTELVEGDACGIGTWYGRIGPLQDPVTWYGINYAWTQLTQWDFENKGTLTSSARLSFVLKAPLCYLRPSLIYSVHNM